VSEQASIRTTTDWLLDLCVYAPIGFVLDAHKYVPEFVERGRSQVGLAKVIGKFAVDKLEQQLGPLATLLTCPDRSAPAQAPAAPAGAATDATAPDAPVPEEASAAEPAGSAEPAVVAAPPAGATGTNGAEPEAEPDEGSLAIAGYSTLSASQIVPRLTTLTAADLDAIARFERAHRARRTILNRVEQLRAGR